VVTTPIYQSSENMPSPVIINGLPYANSSQAPWLPTSKTFQVWAKQLRVVVNGFDVTFFRGLPTIVNSWASQEPGGDATATFTFPGITTYDRLPLPFTYPSGEVQGIARSYTGNGYWQASADGLIIDYGDAAYYPPAIGILNAHVVGVDAHPSAYGYAAVAQDGGVFCYGAVGFQGSIPGRGDALPWPITDIAITRTGNGYWLVGAGGRVYAFGDATSYGDAPIGATTNGPFAVGICRSTTGLGYQIVSSNGSCYAFGDAGYHGNPTSVGYPMQGVARYPGPGDGFFITDSNGNVFPMGAASNHGNLNLGLLAEPINAMDSTPSGNGYWLSAGDGGVFAFGDAVFYGSVPSGGTPAGGSLSWARLGAGVHINYIDNSNNEHTLFEGVLFDWEDQGESMQAQCIGSVFQLDWYLAKPMVNLPFLGYSQDTGLPIFGWDSGVAIATAINNTIESPSMGSASTGAFPPAPSASPLRLGYCAPVATGITTTQRGAWDQLFSSYIQNILTQCQQAGVYQWTVVNARYVGGPAWLPAIAIKGSGSAGWTVSAGAHGVETSLAYDVSQSATVIYGTGQSPPVYSQQAGSGTSVQTIATSGSWANMKYPKSYPNVTPTYPFHGTLFVFAPGDGHTGFRPFSDWLRWSGVPMQSQDTYHGSMLVGLGSLPSFDDFLVRQFQIMAGLPPTGIVDETTWNAAFQHGANEGDNNSVHYQPLWELGAVEPHTFTPSGAWIGFNSSYNPSALRVERFENSGSQVAKVQGIVSSFIEGERMQNPGWTGTINLSADPQEGSRYAIKAGDNIVLQYFHGENVQFHISQVQVNLDQEQVSLTVASIAQDYMTVSALIARDAATYGVSRAARPSLTNLNISQQTTVFDSESSAGVVPPIYVPFRGWTVWKVAFSESGSVAETIMTASPATTFAMAVFSGPVDPGALYSVLPAPDSNNPVTGNNPWNDAAQTLDAWGLLYASGGPGNMLGYYPNDGSVQGATVTGKMVDGSTWTYFSAPGYSPWLWVAFWASADMFVNGNFLVAPPA
jgi:hypothetical protein